MESARCLTPLGGVVIARVEGDGWVDWSGLATRLATIEKAVVGKMNRFFLNLRLHQGHQDVEG
jgi:hypothetical protein